MANMLRRGKRTAMKGDFFTGLIAVIYARR